MSDDHPITKWTVRDGQRVIQMPHPVYHAAVEEFFPLCGETSACMSVFAVLPEDPPGTDRDGGVAEVLAEVASFESPSLDQCGRR